MKISLCTLPIEPDWENTAYDGSLGQFPIPPKIQIVALINWMEKHGYSSEMYDWYDIDMLLPTLDELRDYFRSYQPSVVGISAVVSTSYLNVKVLSKLIRNVCPDAWIVCGGSLSASSNLVLRKTEVDICISGDGEIPWVEFLDYAKENNRQWKWEILKGIKGLSFLDENCELQFNGYPLRPPSSYMPFPDYGGILLDGLQSKPEKIDNYFRKGVNSEWFRTDPRAWESHRRPNLSNVWITKGCVARCTFCQRSIEGYRTSEASSIEDHLRILKEHYDVGYIHVTDENFGSDRKHTYEVARLFKKYDMLWVCSGVRCSSVTREDIIFYKTHGCSGYKFGVETGSQKMLDIMEKRFTVKNILDALSYCNEVELYSPIAVMVGMPGETLETAKETGQLLGKIAHMQGVHPRNLGINIFYALPLPGTPLYEYGQQIGAIGKTPEEEEEFLLRVSGTGAGKMNFINLNGSKTKEVIFWDILERLEASRTFHELEKKERCKKSFLSNQIEHDKIHGVETISSSEKKEDKEREVGLFTHRFVGWKSAIFFAATYFIEKHIINNRIVDALPRNIVYPFVQGVLLIEYRCQVIVLKMFKKRFNMFDYIYNVPLIDGRYDKTKNMAGRKHHLANKTTGSSEREIRISGRDRSLRHLVAQEHIEGEDLTEKNRQILARGL